MVYNVCDCGSSGGGVEQGFYRTGRFAKRAGISVRTLHYYDRVGLLSPSHYTESGYRLYTEEDYPRLQQILGLKYLGFTLDEIRACLRSKPGQFGRALAVQKAMLQERKAHLEKIIQTIEETQSRLADNPSDWEPILKIIEVIEMSEKNDWKAKYFTDEQLNKMGELSNSSYTEEDRKKIAEWGKNWSEQDQLESNRKWAELYAEAKRLADSGVDPAGAQAQALAGRWMALVNEFTRGDPGVTAGLGKLRQKLSELPPEQSPLPKVLNGEQERFVQRMLEAYRPKA